MGDVIQFRRKPAVQAGSGFGIVVKPEEAKVLADKWGIQDRGGYRLAPDRDGSVLLEIAHPGGVVRLTMSVEDAEQLRSDLSRVTQAAEAQRRRARGASKWITAPIEGRDAYTVTFDDKEALFVAVKLRRERPCEFCRARMPAGSVMYRQEGQSRGRWRGSGPMRTWGPILCDMTRRVCRACMSPPAQRESLAPVGA